MSFWGYPVRYSRRGNTTTATTELQNPLSVHGGFIALAAGLSVVVPLVCVLIIQLRRAKREEQNRAAQAGGADGSDGNESGGDGLAEPPPTYEQLFGPGYEPHLNIMHSRFNSTDVLIAEDEIAANTAAGTGTATRVGGGVTNRAAVGDSDSGEDENNAGSSAVNTTSNITRCHNQATLATIATISGNDVTDLSLSQRQGQQHTTAAVANSGGRGQGQGRLMSNTATSTGGGVGVSLNASNLDPTHQTGDRGTATDQTTASTSPQTNNAGSPTTANSSPSSSTPSSSTSATISHTTSTSSSSPSSSSSSSSSPPTPPPVYSQQSQNTTSVTSQSEGANQTTAPAVSPTTSSNRGFRLPGMHISLHDFFSALHSQSEREAPPPSYEEALKILEKAEKAKKKENKDS